MPRHSRDERRDRSLHVAGAAPIQHAVPHLAAKRIGPPVRRPDRHNIGMPGEAYVRAACANPRKKVFGLAIAQPMHCETQTAQHTRKHVLTVIRRRDRGAADQSLCQRQRAGKIVQSRNSSLMEVFARVCASTVLTITAQYKDGPGEPSGSGFPARIPARRQNTKARDP